MLEINGKQYDVKFNYQFAGRLVKNYSNDDADGFDKLIGEIMDHDPIALVDGYYYALDVDTKELPSKDAVAQALSKAGIFDKGEQAFSDLFQQIIDNGFLKLKLDHLLNIRENEVKNAKQLLSVVTSKEDKQSTKVQIKQAELVLKEFKDEIKELSK